MLHTLTVSGWSAPLRRPPMPAPEEARPGLELTNRALVLDGVPTIPVSGELHYSRVPRRRWRERLELMVSGGITVVASYVPWIHHVPSRGEPDFGGGLDVGAFVDTCADVGLDVVLRIGPWCHGEIRNGGFPDWVQGADVEHRTDDPGYLDLVQEWFGQLSGALAGRCGPQGPVIGVQLENELEHQPDHIATLKRLARAAGIAAPLWTATAWGGAQLPLPEVMPVFGGYGDGFWVDADAPWAPTFRAHYLFSHTWDDAGIGADVRTPSTGGAASSEPGTSFPAATCELGGGMATTYHRRPRPSALDVAAVAHTKIGNGSAWQGYYMYAGGTNPGRDLQESHATGYPNDLPVLSYDFHAPIGEAGRLAPSHAELRRQHAFLAAFGHRLAGWPSALPDVLPTGVEDATTLRWAYRGDGDEGVVLLAWHQPHEPLAATGPLRLRIEAAGGGVELPSRPVVIPPGTLARWPVGLRVGGVRIDWATASLLTVLPAPVDGVETLVLVADEGIAAEIVVDGVARVVEPGLRSVRLTQGEHALDVLVLDAARARSVWVREQPVRTLLLSDATLRWPATGEVTMTGPAGSAVGRYHPATGRFVEVEITQEGPEPREATIDPVLVRAAEGPVPAGYGRYRGRESAPSREAFEARAAVWRLDLPAWTREAPERTYLRIDLACDVAELRADGTATSDRFWDGSTWWVNVADTRLAEAAEVTLHALPLSESSTIWLPEDAQPRRVGAGDLLALDAVTLVRGGQWHLSGAGAEEGERGGDGGADAGLQGRVHDRPEVR